ncbi:MAG: AbrB/MazE/SpoVT family DNA-binding domain-containing protein [Desulfurococcales archaeon]|nr:AbrB/MazE/SpoVT family DNA-binding domain-containing protein [Desulfurococcales archaeon]
MARTLGGEVRRVQRLGSSSLVVTLPKSWVKALNLKPGDPVYVVVEGRSVRVMPVEGEHVGSAALRLQGVSAEEARRFLWCAYVIGPEEVLVESPSEGVYEALREAALNLVGVEVSKDEDGVRISVLVDPSRLDPKSSIRAIAGDLEEIVKGLMRVLRGEAGLEDVATLKRSLSRSLALVERGLLASLSLQPSRESMILVNTLVAANFLGLAASTFAEAAERAAERGVKNDEIAGELESLARIAMEAALNVAQPSLKRSRDLLEALGKARSSVFEKAFSSDTPKEASLILAIIGEALKHLQVATTISYCTARILGNT